MPVLLLLLAAATSSSTPSFIGFQRQNIVSTHEIRVSVRKPSGFRAAGPVHHTPLFSGHPYAVSLAAYLGETAFLMVHAERVVDRSGASDYSKLERYRLGEEEFRTRVQCAPH